MSSRNTIFGDRQKEQPTPLIAKKTPTTDKTRKKRSDAKHDIKFKLSAEDKKKLKFGAKDHNLSLTAFASFVVKTELERSKEYEPIEYDHNGQFIHVMLDSDTFRVVQDLSIEWDLPWRHVAHRIVKTYIQRLTDELKINHYRSGR